jgi:hypothetical protein
MLMMECTESVARTRGRIRHGVAIPSVAFSFFATLACCDQGDRDGTSQLRGSERALVDDPNAKRRAGYSGLSKFDCQIDEIAGFD